MREKEREKRKERRKEEEREAPLLSRIFGDRTVDFCRSKRQGSST